MSSSAKNRRPITEKLLERVAQRLKAMGSPVRLRILHALEDGERSVTEILGAAKSTQANVSKHLAVLRSAGLVKSRRDGLSIYYEVADPIVLLVCRTMCDVILRQASEDARMLAPPERARGATALK